MTCSMKWTPWTVCLGVIFGLLGRVSMVHAQNSGKPPILVGQVAAMQGEWADYGLSANAGAQLAVEEINKAGGINGRPLQLLTEDNKCVATESGKLVRKLVTQDGCVAILGEIASASSLNMAPVCKDLQVPQLTPGSTRDELSAPKYDWTFRTCFKDSFQGGVIAKFALENLKAKKAALIFARGNAYSEGLADNVRKTFLKGQGAAIVVDESYGKDDRDYSSILNKVKAANPDVVFATGYYQETARLIDQARKMGITVPFLGGDGWSSKELLDKGGKAVEGCYFSDHYAADNPSPLVQKYVTNFKAKYPGGKFEPNSMSALGYDAVFMLTAALKKDPDNPATIREELAKIKDFEGVTGKMTMQSDRSMAKSAVIIAIQDGKFTYHTTINP